MILRHLRELPYTSMLNSVSVLILREVWNYEQLLAKGFKYVWVITISLFDSYYNSVGTYITLSSAPLIALPHT